MVSISPTTADDPPTKNPSNSFPMLYNANLPFALKLTEKIQNENMAICHVLHVTGAEGFEPSNAVLETAVLPLHYAPL